MKTELDLNSDQQATLVRVMQGDALCLVNKIRIEQITKHGHGDEADAMEPVDYLPRRAREELNAVLEDLRLLGDQGPRLAYNRLAKAAAMVLAAMDRIALAKNITADRPDTVAVMSGTFAREDAA